MVAATPALVIQPVSVRDVVAAVRFAHRFNVLLSIKGGGHNIGGTSLTEERPDARHVTDARYHRQSRDETRTRRARVPVEGRRRGDANHGLATVLGFISEVGVAGLTLGGGLGYLTRRFGWTVDNLDEVEIVTADGQIRTANRHQHADLFWALRGAGANLGVVTRFTFRLHEVGPTVYGGLIAWPFERADAILKAYWTITAEAPRELAVWMILLNAPPMPFVPAEWHGRKICAMVVCYSGDLDRTEEALAPIRALGEPVVDVLQEWPYIRQQSFLDEGEPKGAHYYMKTEYVADLSDGLLTAALEAFAACPIPDGQVGLLHLGGAVNERDEDDGAVGNRNARFVLGVLGMWEADEPNANAFQRWVHDGWARVRPFSTGRTYINFQTADETEDRVRATYGGNFERLVRVKDKYDPDNLFRRNRNIRPPAAKTS